MMRKQPLPEYYNLILLQETSLLLTKKIVGIPITCKLKVYMANATK